MYSIGIIGLGWLGEKLAFSLLKDGKKVWGTYRTNPSHFRNSYQIDSELPFASHLVLCFPPNRISVNAFSEEVLKIVDRFTDETKVILVSSTSVYANSNGICKEDEASIVYEENNPNFITEEFLRKKLNKRLTIIRMGGLIGGKRYPVVFMSKSGKSYSGLDPVNVIHQEDAVNLIRFVLEKDIFGETINGCSSEHPSKKEYYTWMANQLEISIPNFIDQMETQKVISNDKSIELGFNYIYKSPFSYPIIL